MYILCLEMCSFEMCRVDLCLEQNGVMSYCKMMQSLVTLNIAM